MTRQQPDFKNKSKNNDGFYDLRDDWGLIEASFAKQYGIRIRQQTDMPWDEFCELLAGLMPDTPLGQVVSIRAEKDPKTIQSFTPYQRKIRSDWMSKQAKSVSKEAFVQNMADLEKMLENMFGKKVK
jgi:hypothetical protein